MKKRMINVSMQGMVNSKSTKIINQGNVFPWSTPRELNSQNKNDLLTQFAREFSPLFNAIWEGPLSSWVRNEIANNPAEFWEKYTRYDHDTDRLVLTNIHSFSYKDREPRDMSVNCCNVPFKMQHCNREFELNRVCEIECENEKLRYLAQKRKSNRFVSEEDGHIITNKVTNDFNFLLSFTFDRLRHALVGTSNTTSDGLGEFNGLKSFADSQYTVKVVGGNIIGSLESMKCRINGMSFNQGSTIIAFPERLKAAFENAVAKNLLGNYYEGISYVDGTYYYYDNKVIFDPYVDYIADVDMGSALLLDTRFVGFLWGLPNMAIPMEFLDSPAYDLEREEHYAEEDTLNDTKGNCLSNCRSIYDYGTAIVTDYNYLMKVTNIANADTCPAAVFEGTNQSIAPKTPTLV
ncbi:hypothetical protein [Enterococcus larvae]|uniref:hypothetical protein n=1 Tax=Enterococcus larvae TaxID=2794352 RepID=UPI003F2BDA76